MLTNAQIAATLEQVADLLEFQGANAFRVRAYRNAARVIRNLTHEVARLVAEAPHTLAEIDGIGTAVAEKCVTLVQTGRLPQLEALLDEIPESVLTLLRIPGVGPRKAAVLYRELGVATLDQLRAACEAQQVRALKGFGAKTEQAILDGLPVAEAAGQRVYWAEAEPLVAQLRDHLQACAAVDQLEFAGSYRRGKETVGDLDALVVSTAPHEVMEHLASSRLVAETLARGDTKMSVRLATGLQVDLRVVPPASFGAALQYFTGSKEHNVALRSRAKQRGLKINEYGVYRTVEGAEQYVAGATEEDVYGCLGLPVFPPELREARQEFHWADAGQLPELVVERDVRGDLHMHTTATDGVDSLPDMVAAAQRRGWEYVAITDHSQRVTMARGLDPHRLLAQWREIDALQAQAPAGFRILKGIEVDILEKGGLDLPDDVLAQADWVVASIHYGQRQPRAQITARIVQALANPHVSAIAHPTGRLLLRRDPYDVDVTAMLQAAKEYGKCLELNANPMRLDLDDVDCAAARELGVPIVICTDAHSVEGLDVMRYGVLQARRAGLTAADVANTRSWSQLRQLLGRAE
ncbi:MAG: DNA polymerase/3'-5' exonuclease PolX [Pirellulaceae bacterium]|jgi:DNA polymerase (family 10)|nr:DNA polymerase/3'-5' exonuclease PolX [Pirellulaceae bacterium]